MARCLFRLDEDKYIEWSTIVDAPVTYVMTKEEALSHLYENWKDVPDQIEHFLKHGITWPYTVESMISYNRAGKNETCLTREEIIEQYTRK